MYTLPFLSVLESKISETWVPSVGRLIIAPFSCFTSCESLYRSSLAVEKNEVIYVQVVDSTYEENVLHNMITVSMGKCNVHMSLHSFKKAKFYSFLILWSKEKNVYSVLNISRNYEISMISCFQNFSAVTKEDVSVLVEQPLVVEL